jgi:putative membrane protein
LGEPLMSDDATRRTQLASERTQLAWWRTGLTALAVSIGVGRLVPALDDSTVEWPYTLLGVAFALYGIALIGYGNLRGTAVMRAVSEGGFAQPSAVVSTALGVVGGMLGLATAVVVVAN